MKEKELSHDLCLESLHTSEISLKLLNNSVNGQSE